MELKDIQEHLRLHKLWVENDPKGSRANLYGADLSGANLSGANLSRADLSRADLYGADLSKTLLEDKAVLTFWFNKHTAYYFGNDEITIGCHKHSIAHWVKNFKTIGKSNNYSDIEIEKYGKFIRGCANIQKEMKPSTEQKGETK
jgi:hypothetical protein